MAVLYGAFTTSCAPEDDLVSALHEKSYVTLSRVVIPLDNNDNTKEHITVESVRVLIFDGISGNIISNTLVSGENNISGSYDASHNAYIISLNNTAIAAYAGNHDVYVVLNENAFGANLGLGSVTTKKGMNDIKNQPVPYNTIMAVPAGNEPPFLMCTYDKVNIPSGSTATNPFVIDMTGLDAGDYAFSMRRSMAKIVLESVWGGVKPDGNNTILGTGISFDPTATTDQTGNGDIVQIDKDGNMTGGNTDLAATSEVFVTKVELWNVPNSYSWAQDKDQTVYTGNYLDPLDISSGFALDGNYFERNWLGDITTSGTVNFTRTDSMPAIYKYAMNGKAYGINEVYPYNTIEKNPDDFTSSGPYDLNSGNFITWIQDVYGDKNNYQEGEVVPNNLNLQSKLNPAVWTLKGNCAYYIPENIGNKNTTLRVYFSIGSIMANISDEELDKIVQDAIKKSDVTIEGGESGTVNFNESKNAVMEVIRGMGGYVENKSELGDGLLPNGNPVAIEDDQKYGIYYTGVKTIWSNKEPIDVTEREGEFYVDTTNNFYIDVLLNNDDEKGFDDAEDDENVGSKDHNIYRGYEYRVKLYVTRSNEKWPYRNAGAASRTINIGGEELTITGKVTASPIK